MPATTLFVVTGRDLNGCSARDSAIIPVDRETAIFVPTAFSPNGDAANDIIAVTPLCNFIFKRFRIFNRYGEMVFSSENVSAGWNGLYGGTPAAAGVYYYYVEGMRENNTRVIFKGDITL